MHINLLPLHRSSSPESLPSQASDVMACGHRLSILSLGLLATLPIQVAQARETSGLSLAVSTRLASPPTERPAPTAAPMAQAPAAPPRPRDDSAPRLMALDVKINGGAAGSWTLLEIDGDLYATGEELDEWRVMRPNQSESITFRRLAWYPLKAIPGFSAELNLAEQSVSLQFNALAFAATRVTQTAAKRPPLSPPLRSVFLNYELNYSNTRSSTSASTRQTGGLFELGISGPAGLLTQSMVAAPPSTEGARRSLVRLETTYSRDMPERNVTLKVGDTTTRSASWGRSTFFGGIQLGTNYGLTPGFITQPIPVLAGTASAPSTVELYVNDQLRQTSRVPAGPFSIENVQALLGTGQAKIVVRDLLGRETVLTEDLSGAAGLLEENLSDWSVELGAIRRNLGTVSSDYREPFVAGYLRHGVSKTLTLESRAELTSSSRTAGLGLVAALPGNWLGRLAGASNWNRDSPAGRRWVAGLQYASQLQSASFNYTHSDQHFRFLGFDSSAAGSAREMSLGYALNIGRSGSIGLNIATVSTLDRGDTSTASLSYSARLGETASLYVGATHVKGDNGGTAFNVSLVIPLSPNMYTEARAATRPGGRPDASFSAYKTATLPVDTSWRTSAGWRAGTRFAEGGVNYQGPHGIVAADGYADSNQQAIRLGARGGILATDGELFFTRRVDSSFALVEVKDFANIGVGPSGNFVTKTDKAGRALVIGLQPYQLNSIRLDPAELPINAEIESIEQIVVPAARSGVKAVFPVRSGRGALVKIEFDDGEPAPPGAELELVGDKTEFYVARRGEVFITGLQPANQLRLKWKGASCSFQLNLPPSETDEIARIGPLRCPGIKR